MDNKQYLNELLTRLVETAEKNNNEISKDKVREITSPLLDSEEEYLLVYQYLASKKIRVDGILYSENSLVSGDDASDNAASGSSEPKSQPDSQEKTSTSAYHQKKSPDTNTQRIDSSGDDTDSGIYDEEKNYTEFYLEDISGYRDMTRKEADEAMSRILNGELDMVENVVCGHLHFLLEIVEEFKSTDLSYGDLISESNLELMNSISEYTKKDISFQDFLSERVRAALTKAANLETSSERIGEHIAGKLNRLDEVTTALSKQLGRTPEVTDIAQEMSISEEEASMLLKLSLDVLSVNEDTKITDEKNSDFDFEAVKEEKSSEENSDDDFPYDITRSSSNPLKWTLKKKTDK